MYLFLIYFKSFPPRFWVDHLSLGALFLKLMILSGSKRGPQKLVKVGMEEFSLPKYASASVRIILHHLGLIQGKGAIKD